MEISERETEHERLLTLGNEQGVVEGALVSFERSMDKEDVVYVYNGILLSH